MPEGIVQKLVKRAAKLVMESISAVDCDDVIYAAIIVTREPWKSALE